MKHDTMSNQSRNEVPSSGNKIYFSLNLFSSFPSFPLTILQRAGLKISKMRKLQKVKENHK